MNKSYLIQWRSKVNGRTGRGTKLFEKLEAEQLVEELNREYPQIEHRLSEVQAETAPERQTEAAPAQQGETPQPPSAETPQPTEDAESPAAPQPAALSTS